MGSILSKIFGGGGSSSHSNHHQQDQQLSLPAPNQNDSKKSDKKVKKSPSNKSSKSNKSFKNLFSTTPHSDSATEIVNASPPPPIPLPPAAVVKPNIVEVEVDKTLFDNKPAVYTSTLKTKIESSPPHPLEQELSAVQRGVIQVVQGATKTIHDDLNGRLAQHPLESIDNDNVEQGAAIKIQAGIRGFLARKQVDEIRKNSFDKKEEDAGSVSPTKISHQIEIKKASRIETPIPSSPTPAADDLTISETLTDIKKQDEELEIFRKINEINKLLSSDDESNDVSLKKSSISEPLTEAKILDELNQTILAHEEMLIEPAFPNIKNTSKKIQNQLIDDGAEIIKNSLNKIDDEDDDDVKVLSLEDESLENNKNPLTKEEAAIKIQAAFRGYEVRKTLSREHSPMKGMDEIEETIEAKKVSTVDKSFFDQLQSASMNTSNFLDSLVKAPNSILNQVQQSKNSLTNQANQVYGDMSAVMRQAQDAKNQFSGILGTLQSSNDSEEPPKSFKEQASEIMGNLVERPKEYLANIAIQQATNQLKMQAEQALQREISSASKTATDKFQQSTDFLKKQAHDFFDDLAQKPKFLVENIFSTNRTMDDQSPGSFNASSSAKQTINEPISQKSSDDLILDDLAHVLEEVANAQEQAIQDSTDSLKEKATEVYEQLAQQKPKEVLETFSANIKTTSLQAEKGFDDFVSKAQDSIADQFEESTQNLKSQAFDLGEVLTPKQQEIVENIEATLKDWSQEKVPKIQESALETVSTCIEKTNDKASELLDDIESSKDAIEEKIQKSQQDLQNQAQLVLDGISQAQESIEEKVEKSLASLNELTNKSKNIIEQGTNEIEEAKLALTDSVEKFGQQTEQALDNNAHQVEESINKAISQVNNQTSKTIESVQESVDSVQKQASETMASLVSQADQTKQQLESCINEKVEQSTETIKEQAEQMFENAAKVPEVVQNSLNEKSSEAVAAIVERPKNFLGNLSAAIKNVDEKLEQINESLETIPEESKKTPQSPPASKIPILSVNKIEEFVKDNSLNLVNQVLSSPESPGETITLGSASEDESSLSLSLSLPNREQRGSSPNPGKKSKRRNRGKKKH